MTIPDAIPTAAKLLLTAGTLAYGIGPFITDFNKTHLLNPSWPGHARFHLVWASVAQLGMSGIALWLLWSGHGPDAFLRARLATAIGMSMTSGFFVAVLFKKWYRGTLHDAHGIPPIGGKVDGNIIAILLILGMLIAGWIKLEWSR